MGLLIGAREEILYVFDVDDDDDRIVGCMFFQSMLYG